MSSLPKMFVGCNTFLSTPSLDRQKISQASDTLTVYLDSCFLYVSKAFKVRVSKERFSFGMWVDSKKTRMKPDEDTTCF